MHKLYLDLETYNDVPLTVGSYKYAETVEIMLLTYAIDDGPVECWDIVNGYEAPDNLLAAWGDDDFIVIAHNGGLFDRIMLNHHDVLPEISIFRWLDTMVQAYAHGLPGSLSTLGEIYGLKEEDAKIKEGRQLIHLFCKPYRGRRIRPEDEPVKWQQFIEYAKRDVSAMRLLHEKMPSWNYPGPKFWSDRIPSDTRRYWFYDLAINDRGIQLDTDLCISAMRTAVDEKHALNARVQEATNDEVQAATQRDVLLKYLLKEHGVDLPDLRASTLKRRIGDPALPDALRELLEIRLASSKNTSAKYKAAVKSVCLDGRVRGMHQFRGAAMTGRDAGRLLQLQNLARPTMKPGAIEAAIKDIKSGHADLLYSDMSTVLNNCVRGILVPAPGKKFIVTDLSAVEARVLAWLAGEEKVLNFFRDYDSGAAKYDQYMLGYANTFNVSPESVTPFQRQLGKVLELSLGYGGAHGAFLTFALTNNLNLEVIATEVHKIADASALADCESKYEWAKKNDFHVGLEKRVYVAVEHLKRNWRDSRSRTVAFWKLLNDAMVSAINNKGTVYKVGSHIQIGCSKEQLRIRLPSGRDLSIAKPKLIEDASGRTSICFKGLDRYTHKWSLQYVHGGKAAGWVTQAVAVDLLQAAYECAEDNSMPVVLRVHDELVTEVWDTSKMKAEHLTRIMTHNPPWAMGLPLAAVGWEGYRYGKE